MKTSSIFDWKKSEKEDKLISNPFTLTELNVIYKLSQVVDEEVYLEEEELVVFDRIKGILDHYLTPQQPESVTQPEQVNKLISDDIEIYDSSSSVNCNLHGSPKELHPKYPNLVCPICVYGEEVK